GRKKSRKNDLGGGSGEGIESVGNVGRNHQAHAPSARTRRAGQGLLSAPDRRREGSRNPLVLDDGRFSAIGGDFSRGRRSVCPVSADVRSLQLGTGRRRLQDDRSKDRSLAERVGNPAAGDRGSDNLGRGNR